MCVCWNEVPRGMLGKEPRTQAGGARHGDDQRHVYPVVDEETRYLDTPAGWVRVQSTQAERTGVVRCMWHGRGFCRSVLILFPQFYALVLTPSKGWMTRSSHQRSEKAGTRAIPRNGVCGPITVRCESCPQWRSKEFQRLKSLQHRCMFEPRSKMVR